jgi:hypothetical protein
VAIAQFGGYVLAALTAIAAVHDLARQPPSVSATANASCRESAAGAAHALQLTLIDSTGAAVRDARVLLTRGGAPVAAARCRSAWLMFDVAPGRYRIDAVSGHAIKVRTVDVPSGGHTRIALSLRA